MAAIPLPATAPRARCRTWAEKIVKAECDARAAEEAVRATRAAVCEAHRTWSEARSEGDRQAAAAHYRRLEGVVRRAERAADRAWRRFCRILDDR